MNTNERAEYAVALKHAGSNCCQAVLLAYADLLPLPPEQLRAIGAGFGVGMGCMEATCGALCGAQIVMGITRTAPGPALGDARALLTAFRQKTGATLCRELKGLDTGKVLCPCDDCVRCAVQALEEH